MKKILITGSTTGLGLLAAQMLMKQGHQVVLHARNEQSSMTESTPYVIGDFTSLEGIKAVVEQANALGKFDVIIHNAGVYNTGPEELFNVNVLAPFVISTLMNRPERLIFLSSGMHLGGKFELLIDKLTYSDSKLYDLMLAKWFSRMWPDSYVNAVDPGWVPTRMGGAGAPDDLAKGAETQSWLSSSKDNEALVTGKYFHHKEQHKYNPLADSEELQKKLISFLGKRA